MTPMAPIVNAMLIRIETDTNLGNSKGLGLIGSTVRLNLRQRLEHIRFGEEIVERKQTR